MALSASFGEMSIGGSDSLNDSTETAGWNGTLQECLAKMREAYPLLWIDKTNVSEDGSVTKYLICRKRRTGAKTCRFSATFMWFANEATMAMGKQPHNHQDTPRKRMKMTATARKFVKDQVEAKVRPKRRVTGKKEPRNLF